MMSGLPSAGRGRSVPPGTASEEGGEVMPRKRLGELLVQAKIIDETQLKTALAEHPRWGTPLGLTLLSLGMVREKTLVRALSHQLNIPSIDLETTGVSKGVLRFLPV